MGFLSSVSKHFEKVPTNCIIMYAPVNLVDVLIIIIIVVTAVALSILLKFISKDFVSSTAIL